MFMFVSTRRRRGKHLGLQAFQFHPAVPLRFHLLDHRLTRQSVLQQRLNRHPPRATANHGQTGHADHYPLPGFHEATDNEKSAAFHAK